MALSGRLVARLVKPQPAGNVLDCLGADTRYLLEIAGATKGGIPPDLLPTSIAKSDNRPRACQSNTRQPHETNEWSGIRIERPRQRSRRFLRPSRSDCEEAVRHDCPQAYTHHKPQGLRTPPG